MYITLSVSARGGDGVGVPPQMYITLSVSARGGMGWGSPLIRQREDGVGVSPQMAQRSDIPSCLKSSVLEPYFHSVN
jgi:hypothetical protein